MQLITIASALLLAGSAVAAPGTAMRAQRHAAKARAAGTRKGNLMNTVGSGKFELGHGNSEQN